MRIVHLQKYRHGYRGVLEESDQWVLFQYSSAAGLCRLAAYRRSDYLDYAHFTGVMGRFMPANSFLTAPVDLETVDMAGFARLWRQLEKTR